MYLFPFHIAKSPKKKVDNVAKSGLKVVRQQGFFLPFLHTSIKAFTQGKAKPFENNWSLGTKHSWWNWIYKSWLKLANYNTDRIN